jgi:hypothetical protein
LGRAAAFSPACANRVSGRRGVVPARAPVTGVERSESG